MDVRSGIDGHDFERPPVSASQGWVRARKEPLYRRTLKRWMDIGFVLMALPFVAPVVLVLAAVLKVTGQSPFFTQDRVGLGGRTFRLWKLRTMVPDAEARLQDFLQKDDVARREWDTYQKLSHDPRITDFGQFLRKSSLDELPQLWNVFRGDMSLVGPRPALPKEVALYDRDAVRRLDVRPGLTGLWQVSGRSDLPWDETVRLDVFYVDNWSVMQDLSIMMRTAGAVLGSRGAY